MSTAKRFNPSPTNQLCGHTWRTSPLWNSRTNKCEAPACLADALRAYFKADQEIVRAANLCSRHGAPPCACPCRSVGEAREAGAREVAEGAVRLLVDYAYEHGFHEMGYDPVAALIEATQEAERAALSASADGETERLLAAYDDKRNRLAFYEREVNRLEGDPAACRRAEAALREVDEARAALLAHVAAMREQIVDARDWFAETLYEVENHPGMTLRLLAHRMNSMAEALGVKPIALPAEPVAALRPGTTGEGDKDGKILDGLRHAYQVRGSLVRMEMIELIELADRGLARVAQLQARAEAADGLSRRLGEQVSAVLRRAENAEADVARLRDALREYGGHTNECTRTRLGTCNCGWAAVALKGGTP